MTSPRKTENASGPSGFVPFPAERAQRYRAAGHWTTGTVDALLRDTTARRPDATAVIDAHGALSYAELAAAADRAAQGFTALGIGPGDRVLLQLPNRNTFAVALFGLLRARALPIMCLPGHRIAELSHFTEVAGASALVIADTAGGFDYRAMAGELTERHPGLRHVVVDGEAGPFTPWATVAAGSPSPAGLAPADPHGPALLLVSGGTTAAPKLIPRTHADYLYNATASAALCGLTGDDVLMVALPAGHNFPLACPGLLGAIAVGATTVFTADPSPESAFPAIARHRVTVTALVPVLARLWAQATDWEPVLPDSLRLLQVGGAKLGSADAAQIREKLNVTVQQVFGMAEGLLCYTRPDDPAEVVDHTQGRPLCADDEVRVVDEDGAEVAPGCDGELLTRGPYTINGYYRAAAANRTAFTPDGFYRTGDRVRRRPDGNFEVTGRVKDVILRGGESISALDFEAHLHAHPAVDTAAAVGLPDQYLGERVCAAIVFKGAPLSVSQINEHLRERGAAAHLRIDLVAAVPALPVTPVGKIDKRALVATLTAG